MSAPRFSIVIPVFNGARWLPHSIPSALAQEVEGLEVVVVDNASRDRSLEVARSFSDPRLRVAAESDHLPLYANWKRALTHARGERLTLLCCDDQLLPRFLPTLAEALDANPEAGFAACARTAMDEEGREGEVIRPVPSGLLTRGEALRLVGEHGNFIGEPSCVLFPRALYLSCGGFDPASEQIGDLLLWSRFLRKGGLWFHPAPLCRTRRHGGTVTAANMRKGDRCLREEAAFLTEMERETLPAALPPVPARRVLGLLRANFLRHLLTFTLGRALSPGETIRHLAWLGGAAPGAAVRLGAMLAGKAWRKAARGTSRLSPQRRTP